MAKKMEESTVKTYARLRARLKRLGRKLVRDGNIMPDLGAAWTMALALHFLEPSLKPASARLYRSAVLSDPEVLAFPDWDQIRNFLYVDDEETRFERKEFLRREREKLKGVRRGPAQKAESISLKDLGILLGELLRAKRYGKIAASWMLVTVVTGLRPCEWKHARLVGMDLEVRNAKTSQGRAHGEARTLRICDERSRCLVERHLQLVSEALKETGFQELYDGVRKTIHRAARKLWPRRKLFPTLYTGRHMFAANAKSTLPKDAVSALLGHGSIESAARHYAPARYATGGLGVEPSDKDVAAVNELNQGKHVKAEWDTLDGKAPKQ